MPRGSNHCQKNSPRVDIKYSEIICGTTGQEDKVQSSSGFGLWIGGPKETLGAVEGSERVGGC